MVSRQGKHNMVSVTVSDDLADRITQCLTDEPELTQSRLVREALRDKLQEYEQ